MGRETRAPERTCILIGWAWVTSCGGGGASGLLAAALSGLAEEAARSGADGCGRCRLPAGPSAARPKYGWLSASLRGGLWHRVRISRRPSPLLRGPAPALRPALTWRAQAPGHLGGPAPPARCLLPHSRLCLDVVKSRFPAGRTRREELRA